MRGREAALACHAHAGGALVRLSPRLLILSNSSLTHLLLLHKQARAHPGHAGPGESLDSKLNQRHAAGPGERCGGARCALATCWRGVRARGSEAALPAGRRYQAARVEPSGGHLLGHRRRGGRWLSGRASQVRQALKRLSPTRRGALEERISSVRRSSAGRGRATPCGEPNKERGRAAASVLPQMHIGVPLPCTLP